MAISVLGSQLITDSAVTYTAEAGSNRILCCIINAEDGSGAYNPSFGGVSFVDIGSDPFEGNAGTQIYCGYILEANIPSGSQSMSLTTTGMDWTIDLWAGWIFTLDDVDQSTPINPAIDEAGESNSETHTTANVLSVTDGILFASFCAANAIGSSPSITTANWVDEFDDNTGGGAWILGHKLITSGASEGVAFDNDGISRAGSSVIFGLAPAAVVAALVGENTIHSFAVTRAANY